jgi:hypothetical protein
MPTRTETDQRLLEGRHFVVHLEIVKRPLRFQVRTMILIHQQPFLHGLVAASGVANRLPAVEVLAVKQRLEIGSCLGGLTLQLGRTNPRQLESVVAALLNAGERLAAGIEFPSERRRKSEGKMRTVRLESFHLVDVAASGLVPHLQFAVLLMHAQPNGAGASRCRDVEIPPSDERIALLLSKGWNQERADNRFLQERDPVAEDMAAKRRIERARALQSQGAFRRSNPVVADGRRGPVPNAEFCLPVYVHVSWEPHLCLPLR